jgi:hypothetical protein
VSSTRFQPKELEIKSGHPADFSCALSPQSSQIFEPDLEKALDCQGCEQMHKPGKCRGASSRSVDDEIEDESADNRDRIESNHPRDKKRRLICN